MRINTIKKHKIGILITLYKEPSEIIKRLLDSIQIQHNINLKEDIGVYICVDGKDEDNTKLSNKFLNQYTFDIYYKRLQHKGVSSTRNKLLSLSQDDYVMFCDCDDMFCNTLALYNLLTLINNYKDKDIFNSIILMELKKENSDEYFYIKRYDNQTLLQGKLFKRSYLINNNIKSNPKLLISEDLYVVCLAMKLTTNIYLIKEPFYLKVYYKDSVCNSNQKLQFTFLNNAIESGHYLIKQFLKRKRKDVASYFCTDLIYNIYYVITNSKYEDQFKDEVENNFIKFYNKYKKVFNDCSESEKIKIMTNIKKENPIQTYLEKPISFDEWLNDLLKRKNLLN